MSEEGAYDYTESFARYGTIRPVPIFAFEDSEMDAVIFLYEGQSIEDYHLILFEYEQFTPLISIPHDADSFGDC
ncbi:MAG: hypothetical protein JXX29_03730 [Deltaproteobacteria bacterium]|nr:hypothetical protein [Deltaproteobacteria bacterium]MBN2670753.1 hypothetical protein [Deltaproteobacteria bacterium]